MTGRRLAIRYAIFAAVATIANLAVQRLVLMLVEGSLNYPFALVSGTIIGLVVKFKLDKRWIFFDESPTRLHEGAQFTLYTAMGLVTTSIFWLTETATWLASGTTAGREIGAIVGLSIGYWVKYRLDRRFVFKSHST
jgi:putative flippase GtrA